MNRKGSYMIKTRLKTKLKSLVSVVLTMSMVFTMLSNVTFVYALNDNVYEGYEDYTYDDDCEVALMPYDGLESSNLKITQTTMREINAGMTFDDVFIENPVSSSMPYAFINYYKYYNTPQSTEKTFDRSTTLSSVIWGASVSVHDDDNKKITGLTLSIGIEWCNDYGFFNPSTGEADDDGKWSDTGGTEQRIYNKKDNTYGRMATPVRDGYTFVRWYYIENGNKVDTTYQPWYSFKQKTNYPVWQLAKYQIDYELNGGVNSTSNPTSYIYKTGVASFENPTKEYFSFDGWYLDENFNTPVTSISDTNMGDVKLYAKWIQTSFALNFDANGGVDGSKTSVMVPKGDKISDYLTSAVDEVPTKDNSVFSGWVKADGTELTDSDVMTEKGFTVYAKWEASKYKLSFDLNGGTGNISAIDMSYGEKISDNLTDVIPTKTGYTFVGWVKSDGSDLTDADVMTENGFTVYAKWEANKYKLSFDLNGGTGSISDVDVAYGEKISDNLTSIVPTKSGATFAGWVKSDGSDLTDSDVMTESGFKVYAKWEIGKYKLSFDLTGGTGNISDVNVTYGEKISDNLTDVVPTKTGYTFVGWVKSDGSGLADSDVMTEDGFTVYAKWEANKYKLNFDLNGGTGNISDVNIAYGEKISDNLTTVVPTKTGYTFVGWVKTGEVDLTDTDVMTEDGFTVYAKWKANKYKLSFDLNGGIGDTSDIDVAYGEKISDNLTTIVPTKSGATFGGWVKLDGSDLTDADVMTENGFTVYAKWETGKYRLSFDLNGGTGNISDAIVSYGEKISDNLTDVVPTKTGYTFVGWVKSDGSGLADSDVMTEDGFTVYAKWETGKYKLNFDLNGGTGDISDIDVAYGNKISDNLTTVVPTKTGYTFVGWVKTGEADLTDTDVMTENGFTVYAKWEIGKYKLSFDLNGGTGDIPDVDVVYGEKISDNLTDVVPTKTGYKFIGWVKTGEADLTDVDVMTENGFTVYAKWEANKYNISFELNGGEDLSGLTVSYGEKISDVLAGIIPTKTGNKFVGWVKADGTELTDSDVVTENGFTVYAKWEAIKYKLSFDLNGGIGSISDVDVSYGEKISSGLTTSVPTRTGYTFVGWVKTGEAELTDADVMTENGFTVYAKWSVNSISAIEQVISGKLSEVVADDVSINNQILNGTGDYTFEVAPNQTIPNGIVIGSDGKVSGTYLQAGTFTVNVIVTDVNSKVSTTKVVRFEVAKSDAPEIVFPVIDNTVPYGTKLSEIALAGNDYGTFEWVEPDTIADVKNSGYAVKFTPNSESMGKYNYDNIELTKNVAVTVVPAEPTLDETPTASNITRNNTLGNSRIIGGKFIGIDGQEIKGTYEWKEPDTTFDAYNTYQKTVVFTPENPNYSSVEFDINVIVRSSGGTSSVTPVTYTINASCSDGGYISPKGRLQVYEYSNATFTFKPYAGYRVAEVRIDGEKIDSDSTGGRYTFSSIQNYHRIYVEFEEGDATESKKVRVDSDGKTEDTSSDVESSTSKEKVTDSEISNDVQDKVAQVFNTSDDVSYVQGYPDNTFKPYGLLTRAEASVIINNLLKEQSSNVENSSKFTDVNASDWYFKYVSNLTQKGIINGYSDGTFKPNANITRAEMVALVVKAIGLSGEYTSFFSDTKGSWAENAIAIANAQGWVNGYSDGTFKPNANITRAEVTVLMNRVMGRSSSSDDSKANFSDVNPDDWFFGDVSSATGK